MVLQIDSKHILKVFPMPITELDARDKRSWSFPSEAYGRDTARWLSGKESACVTGDVDSVPASPGRFPGEGNGKQLQYFCWESPIDRRALQAIVPGFARESNPTER